MWLIYLYIFLYFFYLIFGYNFLDLIVDGKDINYISLDSNKTSFLFKRLFKLSLLVFLFSAYFLYNPTSNIFFSVVFVQFIVVLYYYLIWGTKQKIEFISHIIWALPIFLYPLYGEINYTNFNYTLPITIVFLLLYNSTKHYIYPIPK